MNKIPTQKKTRIFLVEDQTIVRAALRAVLQLYAHLEVVDEAATLQEALFKVKTLKPHIILLDIRLPDGSGSEGCKDILRISPRSRVLFLTSYTDDDTILATIRSGAHGFLVKEISPKNLVQAIDTVAAGGSILDSVITNRIKQWVEDTKSSPPTTLPREVLSTQETRVLQLIAENITNEEIANALKIRPKTVQNHVFHIFQKLYLTRPT